jgi:CBS domain-containing protein
MTSARGNLYLKKKWDGTHSVLKAIDIARDIIMLDSGKTLLDARNSMLRYNISRIVISLDGKAVGIVTEKDIAKLLYNSPPTKRLNEISLKEFIQKKLITVNENSRIDFCTKLMLKHAISSLIVIESERTDKGIITKTDLIELYAYHQFAHDAVNEYMSKKVQSVAPDETIHMIAMLMNVHKISRIVVQKNKKPIGIVTTRDFLPVSLIHGTESLDSYWTARKHLISAKRSQRFIPTGLMAYVLAQDIMSSPAITVQMNTDTSEAAKIMIRNRISGLPVINGKRNLVGVITKTDILKSNLEAHPHL